MFERNDLIPVIENLYRKYNGKINREFNQGGIRFAADQNKDVFNDYFFIYLPDQGKLFFYKGTTDPGMNATTKKEGGAAHLVEGFWEDMWVLDMHAKDNEAFRHIGFCQRPQFGCKEVKIWRDRNRNTVDDEHVYETRNDIGLNKHRASARTLVDKIGDYSWACQVAQNKDDHEKEVELAKATSMYAKNPRCLFSYLLVKSSDIPEFIV